MLTTTELIAHHGADTTSLHRWRDRGWVRPLEVRRGLGGGSRWPDWTARMVALLLIERPKPGTDGGSNSHDQRRELFCKVADALEGDPTLVWVAFLRGFPIPCATAEELLEVLALVTETVATAVAVPEARVTPRPEPVLARLPWHACA